MSRKWSVDFIDKGNCEIITVKVECFRAYNAPKVAIKQLTAEQQKMVDDECVEVRVVIQ